MGPKVQQTVRELLESTQQTIAELLALPEDELGMPSSHACAQDRDLWTLLTNDIDHEQIHAGQVLEARYEERDPASPMERLVGEWLVARARFAATLIGLSDQQFESETAPGGWTYRTIAEHLTGLEAHSLKTIAKDRAARSA